MRAMAAALALARVGEGTVPSGGLLLVGVKNHTCARLQRGDGGIPGGCWRG